MGLLEKINLIIAITSAGLFILGIGIILYEEIKEFIQILGTFIRTRKRLRLSKESRREKELRYLLNSTINGVLSPFAFKCICTGLFLFFFVATIKALSFFMSLIIAAGFGLLPYILLKWRLSKGRNDASKEAEELLQVLLQSYRINNCNMPLSLQYVISENSYGRLRHTKGILAKLFLNYGRAKNNLEIKEACEEFAYSIGTNWANTLANNFYRSLADRAQVLLSLEDLNSELMSARNLKEEQRRMNFESIVLILFTPVTYILLLVFANFMGTSPKQYLQMQFSTPQTIFLFLGIVLFMVLGILLEYIIRNQKFDI